MKLIHHGGYNDNERDSYKEIIYSNTIQSMRYVPIQVRGLPKDRWTLTLMLFSAPSWKQ